MADLSPTPSSISAPSALTETALPTLTSSPDPSALSSTQPPTTSSSSPSPTSEASSPSSSSADRPSSSPADPPSSSESISPSESDSTSPSSSPLPSSTTTTSSLSDTSSSTPSTSASTQSSTPSSTLFTSSSSQSSFSRTSSAPASSTSVFQSTGSDGEIVRVTTVVQVSPSTDPSAGVTAQSNNSSKGFFANKGAVAGVFTVVGLVALVLFIVLLTNEIRRRRAKKFDRDVAEAAAEAAATAHAARTDFDDDDYGYGANRSVYTDNSHGTYSQQPLQHVESYNMSELPPFDPYSSGARSDNAAGVGASGLNRTKSQTAPYNAFAGPGTQSPPQPAIPMSNDAYYDLNGGGEMPAPGYTGMYGQQQPYSDSHARLVEAAGLAGGAGIATGATLPRQPSQNQNIALQRSTSSGARTLGSSDHQHEAYATHYQTTYDIPQARTAFPQPQPYVQSSMPTYSQPAARPVSMAVSVGDDPYAGYADEPGAPPQSPTHGRLAVSSSLEEHSDDDEPYSTLHHQEQRDSQVSLRDDEDYGYGGGRRVLKVANE